MTVMPETGWTGEPPEPDPPYDSRRVEILVDALTKLPPRDFAGWRERALEEGHEHEWNAAQGLAVEHINGQLATHAPGSPEYLDAVARADELQRITMGDD